MQELLIKLADKVQPREVIYFTIIVGLFVVIWFQEISFRRKDTLFSEMINDLVNEIKENGKQLATLAAIINFLATDSRDENKEQISATEVIGQSRRTTTETQID